MKRYKVTLTTEERCELRDLIAAGKAAAKKLGASCADLAEGRCLSGRPCLDRPTHRRGGRSWRRYRRAGPPALRGGGLGGSLGPQEAGPTQPRAQARWPGRGSPDRLGLLRSASGPPAMDATAFGRPVGRVGGGGRRLRRDGAASSKKRDQAVAERAVVHPAGGGRRVRLCDGGCPGGLPPTLRRAAAAGLPGRGEQATDRRNGAAPASRAGSSGAVRLRVCPQRHGQPVHDLREPLLGWRHVEVTQRRTAKDFCRRCCRLAGRGSAPRSPTRSCW